MHRFTDIESSPKRLTPVYGYLTHPLLPLQKTLEPILSQIDQLDRFSKIAKNECHFPSEHGLNRDESAAVFLYTMEWGENSFYQVINRALRAEDRSSLKPWFAYLKLFDTAVNKLPTVRKNIWRGVARDIAKNFKKGDEFTWWTISSCSTSVDIIKDFLGPNSTLFLIEAVNGKDVSSYTNYPTENEVILCPGTRLRVVSNALDQPPLHLVHLEEVTDDTEEQLSTSLQAMSVSHSSKTQSIHSTVNVQSSPTQVHTDVAGNKYEGEMKGGKRHGKGKMNFANGDIYTGDWIDDMMAGQGVCIWTSGDRYEGQWRGNKKYGKGTNIWGPNHKSAGDKYEGDWIDDDNRTGEGVYTFANGDRYEGSFKDNKKHGKGKMDYSDGSQYAGDWIANKKMGKGTRIWGPKTKWAGDRYEGDWIDDDNRTGQGSYIFANGDRYEGSFKHNKIHGTGKMDHSNGDKYTGDWINDLKTGQGVYIWTSGYRYEGQWKDNKQHGKGKMKYPNGTVQEGMWSNDTFAG